MYIVFFSPSSLESIVRSDSININISLLCTKEYMSKIVIVRDLCRLFGGTS